MLKIQTRAIPNELRNAESAIRDRNTAPKSRTEAGTAKADGRSGETTAETRNERPIKRKLCRISRGRSASAWGRSRNAGQAKCQATSDHATRPNAALSPKT